MKPQHSRNKKLLFAGLGVALLLAVAGILALALMPSGRVRTIRTLDANDSFHREPIAISYRTKGLPHGVATSFQCEDLASLARELPSQLGADYETELFGEHSLLIWQKKLPACYLIQRQTGEQSDSRCNFLLFDMEARLGEGESWQSFVFPYHLIEPLESQGTLYHQFDPAVSCETQHAKQDFLAFYRRLGQYYVTETKDGFQIMREHGPSAETQQKDGETVTAPDRGLDAPVQFIFLQDGGQSFLRLSAPGTDGA